MNLGFSSKKNKEIITKALQDFFPNGEFTPYDVIKVAKPKSSPLHDYFEWDNTKAAEAHRLWQARNIIQCVVVEIQGQELRGYQNVYLQEEDRRVYMRTEKAQKTPEIWEQVLQNALNEIIAWKRRYEKMSQLSLIVEAINKTERRIKNEKQTSRRKGSTNTARRVQAGVSNPGR